MPRVKRGKVRARKRHALLKQAKGYQAGRKNIVRLAKATVKKSRQRAYDHRKTKKREARALWQIKINAACRANGMSYSRFIGKLLKANITLDRKILAQLAEHNPAVFAKIVEKVK